MTHGRRAVLKLGGLALGMAGLELTGTLLTGSGLLQGGDAAARDAAASNAAARPGLRERRAELYQLLGELPDRRRPVGAQKKSEVERDGYVLERWTLDLNGIEPVPALVARPRGATGRLPAVVYNHSHGGGYSIGKTELLESREYMQPTPYAKQLTELGFVVIAIDHWVFGER